MHNEFSVGERKPTAKPKPCGRGGNGAGQVFNCGDKGGDLGRDCVPKSVNHDEAGGGN